MQLRVLCAEARVLDPQLSEQVGLGLALRRGRLGLGHGVGRGHIVVHRLALGVGRLGLLGAPLYVAYNVVHMDNVVKEV